VKLTSLAGAYWRGDEKRKQLTRVYGITFPKQKELEEYLVLLEEAKKRDHRKLGRELELFMFSDTVGKGLPIWLPKGTELRLRLQEYLTKIQKEYGYEQVITPHIGGKQLYVTSGHWDHYGEDSFRPITTPEEGEEYLLKPMNSRLLTSRTLKHRYRSATPTTMRSMWVRTRTGPRPKPPSRRPAPRRVCPLMSNTAKPLSTVLSSTSW